MITVQLHDRLGEMFGRSFALDARSPRDAIYALTKMLKGFDQFVRDHTFSVWVDDKNVGLETLYLDSHADTVVSVALHVEGGGGNGMWMAIAGIAIIVVAWWNPAGWAAGAQLMIAGLGGAIALSGVGQMLMPTMGATTSDEDGNKASYGFGSAVTTTEAGNVVPVAYGECWCGGFVLEYKITTEVLSDV